MLCIAKGVSLNENDFELVLATAGKVIYYSLNCKTMKVLCDDFPKGKFHRLYLNQYSYTCSYQFIESLYVLF
ncbi:hypothetical protein CsSME_00008366 [Camellia sinensis var. sinensis]